jgi:hypothetical protein
MRHAKSALVLQTHFLTSQAAFSLIKLHIIAFNDRRKEAARRSARLNVRHLSSIEILSADKRGYSHQAAHSINHLKRGDFYFYCISSFCAGSARTGTDHLKLHNIFPHSIMNGIQPLILLSDRHARKKERKCRAAIIFAPKIYSLSRRLGFLCALCPLLRIQNVCSWWKESALREYPLLLLGLSA